MVTSTDDPVGLEYAMAPTGNDTFSSFLMIDILSEHVVAWEDVDEDCGATVAAAAATTHVVPFHEQPDKFLQEFSFFFVPQSWPWTLEKLDATSASTSRPEMLDLKGRMFDALLREITDNSIFPFVTDYTR